MKNLLILLFFVLSGCAITTKTSLSPADAERIQFQIELNEYLYQRRLHREYLNSEEYNFVIERYNGHVIYAGSLDKNTNVPIEEIIFYKEKWYHISQNSRLRQIISTESVINFIKWIYAEAN